VALVWHLVTWEGEAGRSWQQALSNSYLPMMGARPVHSEFVSPRIASSSFLWSAPECLHSVSVSACPSSRNAVQCFSISTGVLQGSEGGKWLDILQEAKACAWPTDLLCYWDHTMVPCPDLTQISSMETLVDGRYHLGQWAQMASHCFCVSLYPRTGPKKPAWEDCQEVRICSVPVVIMLRIASHREEVRRTVAMISAPEFLGEDWVWEGIGMRPSSTFPGQFPYKTGKWNSNYAECCINLITELGHSNFIGFLDCFWRGGLAFLVANSKGALA
jgi:hypothetical protein